MKIRAYLAVLAVCLFMPRLGLAQTAIGNLTPATSASGTYLPCATIGVVASTKGCTPAQIVSAGGGAGGISLSSPNTWSGAQTFSGGLSGSLTGTATGLSSVLGCAEHPALTGDLTTPSGSCATTLATVNGNVGSFGSSSVVAIPTVNAKGLVTAVSTATITPAAIGADVSGAASTAQSNAETFSANASNLSSGTVPTAQTSALTGDVTKSAGSAATTLATVNANTGPCGSAATVPVITLIGKGLATGCVATAISINNTQVAGLGPLSTQSSVALTQVAAQVANSVVANASSSSGAPTAVALPSCSGAANALIYTSGTGFGCNTISATGGTPGGSNGQLQFNNSGVFGGVTALPAANFPALTGDVTSAAGSLATTLATVNSTPCTVGSASTVPVITTTGKGLTTACSSATITPAAIGADASGAAAAAQAASLPVGGTAVAASKWATASMLSLTGDGTASLSVDGSANASGALTLATVNSNVGSFGSSSAVPIFTVNGKGQITAASGTAIAINNTQVGGLGTASTVNTGASGATLGLLNANLTFGGADTFSTRPVFNGNTPYDSGNLVAATSTVLGLVKPDGTTLNNSSGAISVTYGTTASTAAQGNDSRITGALSASTASTTYCALAGCSLTGVLTGGASSNVNIPWITSWTPTLPISNASCNNGSTSTVIACTTAGAVPAIQSGLILQGSAPTSAIDNYWLMQLGLYSNGNVNQQDVVVYGGIMMGPNSGSAWFENPDMYRGGICQSATVGGVVYQCGNPAIGYPINSISAPVDSIWSEVDEDNVDKDLPPGNAYGIGMGIFYNSANSYIPSANFTGSISGTTLTVPTGGVTHYYLTPGAIITGSGVTAGTTIVKQFTSSEGGGFRGGATWGGGGTYQVSLSQTIASEAMTMGPSGFANTAIILAADGGSSVGPATVAAKSGNVGAETVSSITVAPAAARYGVWSLIAASSTTFTVLDPADDNYGTATAGTAFSGGGLTFTITNSGTAAAVGDTLYVTVTGAYSAHSLAFIEPNSIQDAIIDDGGNSTYGYFDGGNHTSLIKSSAVYSGAVMDFTSAVVPGATVLSLAPGMRSCYNNGSDCLIYDAVNGFLDFQNNAFTTSAHLSDAGVWTMTGAVVGTPTATNSTIYFNGAAGNNKQLTFQDASVTRWTFTEDPSGNFDFYAYSSSGSYVNNWLSIVNSTGAVTMAGALNVGGVYSSGGTPGVTCSGTPTSSFSAKNGIVTHC